MSTCFWFLFALFLLALSGIAVIALTHCRVEHRPIVAVAAITPILELLYLTFVWSDLSPGIMSLSSGAAIMVNIFFQLFVGIAMEQDGWIEDADNWALASGMHTAFVLVAAVLQVPWILMS